MKMNLLCVIFGIIVCCTPGYNTLRNNTTLVVTSVFSWPWMMPQQDSDPRLVGNARFYGYIVDLLEILADEVQFDYIIKLNPDGRYGSMNASGHWTGMMGELVLGRADIIAADFTMTHQRARVVDFTTPFRSMTTSLLVKSQGDSSNDGLVNPLASFSLGSWALLIGGMVLTCIILRLIVHYNPYDWIRLHEAGHDMKYEADSFQQTGTFWFICSSLLGQGPSIHPRSLGGRTMASIWFLLSIFVTMTFIAASIAQFGLYAYSDVMPHGNYPTEEQIVTRSSEYAIGCSRAFKESTDSKEKRGGTQYDRTCDVTVASNEGGFQQMMINDKFVMKMHTLSAKYYTNRKPCNTRILGTFSATDHLGLAVSLSFDRSMLEKLNLGILRLREDGTLERLQDKWLLGYDECYATKQKRKMKHKAHMDYLDVPGITLGLIELSYIFYILLAGFILSGLAALFEIFAYPKIKHLI